MWPLFDRNNDRMDIIDWTKRSKKPNLTLDDHHTVLDRCDPSIGQRWGFDVFNCPIDLFELLIAINVAHKFESNSVKPRKNTVDKVIAISHAVKEWQCPATLPTRHII